MEWKRIIKGIAKIAGIRIWAASLVPMLVATIMAYAETSDFELKWWALSITGVLLIETGKHCFNDIVDFKSGVDLSLEPDKVTPFSGGKKVLTEKLLTIQEAKFIGILTIIAAAAIGLYIAQFREPKILIIGMLGIFLACAYSLPPFSLCYRSLGELAVGITYGPLILSGMYLVMTGSLDLLPLLVSVPLGILITNVLWINQYPDYEADKKNNKNNWLVRLGKEKGLGIYYMNYAAAYTVFLLISIFTENPLWIICLSTVPLAFKSCNIARKNYDNIAAFTQANKLTINIYQLTGLIIILTVVISDFSI